MIYEGFLYSRELWMHLLLSLIQNLQEVSASKNFERDSNSAQKMTQRLPQKQLR